jgi:type 1 glutamine amidotransferase
MNRILVCLIAVCLSASAFAAKDPYDRTSVPIEVQPTDPKAVKIVLIADAAKDHPPAEHEGFAGNALLAKMLQQTPGIATVMVQDGWPKNPQTLQGARTVVFYMDGGGKQTTIAHAAEIQKLVDAGVGIVHLHQVIDYPTEPGTQAMTWLGGVYDAKSGSARGHWDESFTEFPEHDVTRGVEPFKLNDGWILKLKFVPEMKGITPILRTEQLAPKVKPDKPITGSENIVCWTYNRPDGGRSFVLTGAHNHRTWALPGLRRLVTNGILWSAKVEIPKGGAPIEMDPEDLMTNLERKPMKAVKATVAKPVQ